MADRGLNLMLLTAGHSQILCCRARMHGSLLLRIKCQVVWKHSSILRRLSSLSSPGIRKGRSSLQTSQVLVLQFPMLIRLLIHIFVSSWPWSLRSPLLRLKSFSVLAGGVLDSLFLDYNSVKKLEKMPTKLELIRDAAIMIKKVSIQDSHTSGAALQKEEHLFLRSHTLMPKCKREDHDQHHLPYCRCLPMWLSASRQCQTSLHALLLSWQREQMKMETC